MSEQSGLSNMDKACRREKYWEERTADEKISALRDTVVRLSQRSQDLEKLVGELLRHHHGPDGSLLAPLHIPGGNELSPIGYSYNPAHLLMTERERKG